MNAFEAAALPCFAAAFGEPVLYTGAGLIEEAIVAIKSEVAAGGFSGAGSTAREVSFEVAQALLPAEPAKDDLIAHGGTIWKVIDITRRDDVAAWEMIVSRKYREPA